MNIEFYEEVVHIEIAWMPTFGPPLRPPGVSQKMCTILNLHPGECFQRNTFKEQVGGSDVNSQINPFWPRHSGPKV